MSSACRLKPWGLRLALASLLSGRTHRLSAAGRSSAIRNRSESLPTTANESSGLVGLQGLSRRPKILTSPSPWHQRTIRGKLHETGLTPAAWC